MADLKEVTEQKIVPAESENISAETIAGRKVYEAREQRTVLYTDRPITVEEFLDYSFATGRDLELIGGVMVERTSALWDDENVPTHPAMENKAKRDMAAQLAHEMLFVWLISLANGYAQQSGRGMVLGSRTLVEIKAFSGRLPDLAFVRQERIGIVHQRGIYGAPDLVVEIVSPNDRPGTIQAVEADYCALGVDEIVFIDLPRQRMRVLLRREGAEYVEETFTQGEWQCRALPGFNLQVDWLLKEPRPQMLPTLQRLLDNA